MEHPKLEISTAPRESAVADAPGRSPRVSLACRRCKRRKQRCDGSHPACRTCLKANEECIYEKAIRPKYPGGKSLYISALEERIALLESRLPEHSQDHYDAAPTGAEHRHNPAHGDRAESIDTMSGEDTLSLVDGVAYLSLCATGTGDMAPEPFYLGSSSGATIARMIQSSIYRDTRPRAVTPPVVTQTFHPLRPVSPSVTLSPSVDDYTTPYPSKEEAKRLMDVFFDRLHTRWPVLDRKLYYQAYRQQYMQHDLPLEQRSILHLIYAIAARFLQLMKTKCDVVPEHHLMAAIEHMDHILELHNLATLQFLALLAVHGQRSPYGAGSWSQVRHALTLCIELGLHRRQTTNSPIYDERDLEIRRRVFWSCYSLDRLTSSVLGRSHAIADRDINVELPSNSAKFSDLTADSSVSKEGSVWSNMNPFIHMVKLRRVQSRIHRIVYRVDKPIFELTAAGRERLDNKMQSIRVDLDEWVATLPTAPEDTKCGTQSLDSEAIYHDSKEYFSLQYHKTLLSLFTALLPTLQVGDERFKLGARSAACICTAYKQLNQQRILSYTTIALHSCFIAGLTLVYCLWRDPSIFGYEALEATSACSFCLTVFGEKWPGAIKYRDLFDALSGSLLKTMVGTLKHTEAGNPPTPLNIQLPAPPAMKPSPAATPILDMTAAQNNSKIEDTSANTSANNMLLGAVKQAFIGAGETPDDWPGWRLFDEMVQDNPTIKEDDTQQLDPCDTLYDTTSTFNIDPTLSARYGNVDYTGGLTSSMDMDMTAESCWDFTGYS